MDCAPLNLAHFHERRAEKFLRHARYDEAMKAIQTSLLYLQNAYRICILPKSREVLDTQLWEYERKLQQIKIRKQQHERLNLKEIVPLPDTSSILLHRGPELSVTAQSVAKSIDKTIQEFDAKFTSTLELNTKENQEPKTNTEQSEECSKAEHDSRLDTNKYEQLRHANALMDNDELPMLVPLELPVFDFNLFTGDTATGMMVNIAGLAESLQK